MAPALCMTASACVIFFFSAGCAVFHAKPLLPSQTMSAFESRTLDSPSLREFLERGLRHDIAPWPAISWNFAMFTLVAYYYHPDMDVARAEFEIARAAMITAGSRPNPSLGLGPEFVSNAASGVDPWLLSSILDIPVETGGRRGYRIAKAMHLSAAAHLKIAAAAWRVRSRLRRSLLDLHASLQKVTISKGLVNVQADYVELLKQRVDYGYVSLPDLTQARISLDQSRLSLEETQRQVAENRVKVAKALGLPVAAIEGIALPFGFLQEFPVRPLSEEARREAVLHRPDILSVLSEYESAQSALQLEIAKQYPNLHLGPGYEYDQGENKWRLGFSFSLPIFNQNQGPIAEAEARRTEIAARFMALQASVIGETDLALTGYAKALETLKVADSILAAQKQEEASTRARFESGEDDRLAFLGAKLQVYSAAMARLKAQYTAQQSLGLLEDALGRPIVPGKDHLPATAQGYEGIEEKTR
jgi:cobalt-zinc-cadmium efflux system outer membrane protein